RCHRLNMKTYIINGSEVSRLSVAIQRDYGHQLRQLRLIVFSDQSYEIDLQNQLYPFDSSCYCLTS
ncbi:hypothetical protein, partial [Enterobacter roggenkampii]|uniref:hypothetical protein n=1 Tax=Enterobacter roggenkampii TaxID=1812935 RepID=UPI001CEC041D